jgi:carboxymethylenebutenolidase
MNQVSIQSARVDLTAEDGATLSAYHARPRTPAKAGLIVVQEIFGLNSHIRSQVERFAAAGFEVLAPAFFDRIQKNVELGYDQESIAKARPLVAELGFERPLLDVKAAIARLAPAGLETRGSAREQNKVFIVGYCWGGSLAYLAAARVPGLAAAVGYYGGAISRFADESPRVPTLLHFGEQDASIPLSDVDALRQKQPDVELHVYSAGHGFNCDQRASYSEPAASLALSRTLSFFERALHA